MKGFYPKQRSSGFKHECLHVSPPPPPLTLPLSAPGMHPVIANCKLAKIQNSLSLDVILLLRNYGITFHKERLSKQENTRSGGRGAECRKEFYCNFILIIFKKWTLKLRLVSMFYCRLFNETSLFCFVHQSSIPCKSLVAQKIYLY